MVGRQVPGTKPVQPRRFACPSCGKVSAPTTVRPRCCGQLMTTVK